MAAAEASPAYVPRSFSGTLGMLLGEPFDVQFIDDSLVPRSPRRPVVTPREGGIDDAGQRRKGCGIALGIEHRIVPDADPAQ